MRSVIRRRTRQPRLSDACPSAIGRVFASTIPADSSLTSASKVFRNKSLTRTASDGTSTSRSNEAMSASRDRNPRNLLTSSAVNGSDPLISLRSFASIAILAARSCSSIGDIFTAALNASRFLSRKALRSKCLHINASALDSTIVSKRYASQFESTRCLRSSTNLGPSSANERVSHAAKAALSVS